MDDHTTTTLPQFLDLAIERFEAAVALATVGMPKEDPDHARAYLKAAIETYAQVMIGISVRAIEGADGAVLALREAVATAENALDLLNSMRAILDSQTPPPNPRMN